MTTTAIMTIEPDSLRAGDTWQWRREDLSSDYPASTWTLTYRFKNAAGGFEIVAASDGDDFAITASAVTTTDYVAGVYRWQAQTASAALRFTVDTGTLTVLPGLFIDDAETALDLRSHARKVLGAIEAVMEMRATQDQMAYTINGRSLSRTSIPDLLLLRDRYRAEVAAEIAADRAATGQPDRRRSYVRFHRV